MIPVCPIIIQYVEEHYIRALQCERDERMHRLKIREIMDEDFPAMLEIEKMSFDSPWSGESFMFELSRKYSVGLVAVFREQLVGYLCADYVQHEARILNLAVHPDFRRRGVATLLIREAEKQLKKRGACLST